MKSNFPSTSPSAPPGWKTSAGNIVAEKVGAVEEEVVAEVEERGLEVACVDARGRDAVVCELTNVLGETTAEI